MPEVSPLPSMHTRAIQCRVYIRTPSSTLILGLPGNDPEIPHWFKFLYHMEMGKKLDTVYHAGVETNNGTEALNKPFKYNYLPRQKHMHMHMHMTLSHIISSITEFLPALRYKYVFKNFKQSDLYKSYNPAVVPEYLYGRPKQTIMHCLHRLASSNKFSHSDVPQVAPNSGKFTVKSKKGSQVVEFGDQSEELKCTCKHWLTYHLPCKHFFAVFRYFPDWEWEKLPGSYPSITILDPRQSS